MESSAEVVGVDILLFPVEEEHKAPSPSELPMPSFGFQGMDIERNFQPPSGRDIPSVTVEEPREVSTVTEDQQDRRDCSPEESSSSPRSRTPEIHSGGDSDRSIKLQAKPKASGRTPKGSVGAALQDKRRRQNMLGAVELAGAMQVEPSSDTSDASILYDMADHAVNLAASRTGWQTRTEPPAPRTVASATRTVASATRTLSAPASSCKAAPLAPPPPPPPPPPQSAGIDCTPTAPPRYAGDALLTTSGHEQDIQNNIRAIVGLCKKADVQPPPPFELRFFATVMCQYTGDAPSMFSHVRCHESKAHVYWSFELQEPFSPHQDMSAEQRNLYYFAHGTDTSGIEGMIRSRFIAPATIADGPEAVGHYSQATPWNDDMSCIQTLDRVTNSGKMDVPGDYTGLHQHPRTALRA